MEMITSTANPKIKTYSKLLKKKNRKEWKQFIVEGFHMVEEAIAAGLVVEVLTSDPKQKGTLVAPHVLKQLSSAVTPQPILAVCNKQDDKEMGDKVISLDNVQDPGNVGTIIRSAVAFGFTDVIVHGADVYSDKALRSSQGAIFKINIIQTQDITQYFEGYTNIGAVLDESAVTIDGLEVKQPFNLIVGNEGQGIRPEVISKLNKKVYIPIKFESLNVATAAGILLNKLK